MAMAKKRTCAPSQLQPRYAQLQLRLQLQRNINAQLQLLLQRNVNWLELLPRELVELIMKKLGPVDMIRFKAVCSRWLKAANSYISPSLHQSPWLLLPTYEHDSHSCFFNFAEQKCYKIKNVFQQGGLQFYRPWIAGSSYGWLIIFDKRYNGCLLNPFSGARIELPSIYILNRTTNYQGVFVFKAILLSDPSKSTSGSFSIVIIYGPQYRIVSALAFYDTGSNKSWTPFVDNKFSVYSDILYHNNNLYALHHFNFLPAGPQNGLVEIWNFDDYSPKRVLERIIHTEQPLGDFIFPGVDKLCSHIYLAESLDEIFFVLRVSGKLTTSTSTDNNHHDADYKDEFHVYKLDSCGKRWKKVAEAFGDGEQTLFLGGNQSISLCAREFPEWKKNSLYITVGYGDCWKKLQYFYDLRKVRAHNLQEKENASFIEFNDHDVGKNYEKYDDYSTAFWIVPKFNL